MKTYEELKVGQIRLKGDEVRHKDLGGQIPCRGLLSRNSCYGTKETLVGKLLVQPGTWIPVQLIGHPILQSDLMIAEFRREVAVD